MNEKNYEQQYQALGIRLKPLSPNYSPDDFARRLMKDVPVRTSISYSASTNYKNYNESNNKNNK